MQSPCLRIQDIMYLLVELSFEHTCDSGTLRSTMPKRFLSSPLSHTDADPYPVHQIPALHVRLHRNEFRPCRQRRKTQGISGVRHCVPTLSLISRSISPFTQGMRPVVSNMVFSQTLILPKAIVVFMAGDHDDAISRVDDVISTVHLSSICHVVQVRTHPSS